MKITKLEMLIVSRAEKTPTDIIKKIRAASENAGNMVSYDAEITNASLEKTRRLQLDKAGSVWASLKITRYPTLLFFDVSRDDSAGHIITRLQGNEITIGNISRIILDIDKITTTMPGKYTTGTGEEYPKKWGYLPFGIPCPWKICDFPAWVYLISAMASGYTAARARNNLKYVFGGLAAISLNIYFKKKGHPTQNPKSENLMLIASPPSTQKNQKKGKAGKPTLVSPGKNPEYIL